jgi:hypothetical protein
VFAIRTSARRPRGGVVESTWNRFVQEAQLLPVGEGEYVNPNPIVYQQQHERPNAKGEKVTVTTRWPTEYRDITFPVAIARPEILTQAGQAMALKVFDEVGVAVNTRRWSGKSDPILLGHLRNPVRGRPGVTCFLGWYFDLRAL